MIIYIAVEHYYDDEEILGVFSTREKALDYIGLKILSGRYYVVEEELDKPNEE